MKIYTDGSCGGNPGPGGWGIITISNDEKNWITIKADYENNTTNNKMEMTAIINALNDYGHLNPTVYSDSSYCVNTFNLWYKSWKANGWKKSNKKIPENLDLIKKFDTLIGEGKNINLILIKGHNNNKWNGIIDKIAVYVRENKISINKNKGELDGKII